MSPAILAGHTHNAPLDLTNGLSMIMPCMRRYLSFLFVVLVGAGCASTRVPQPVAEPAAAAPRASVTDATVASDEPLPLDPAIRTGTLENGLRYFIRKNSKPADRAELRLAVDAGSVLEDDDQRGLAHFVEHMAFNGTERFEKQELVDYLELTGSRFGADVNAYTSFDETVYMLKVRTDSIELLDTGIDILREWAGRVAFDTAEVDKERGVVIEEWRLGRGARMRMLNEQLPVLLKGSQYADRLPIGTKENLESFDYETMRRFYDDWYRPDLMAVVVVGDFDVDRVERQVRKGFADLSVPPDQRERLEFSVPDNEEPLVALATDPEAPFGSVSLVFKIPEQDQNSREGYRRGLIESLYHAMFNARLQELTQDTDPPFAFAGSGRGSFARNPDFYNLSALIRDGGMVRALEVLLTEAKRVSRFGFTGSELERAKSDLLRSMERAYNERDKTESARFASEYVRHFLVDEPSPGIAYEYEATREMLPSISLDEINALAGAFVTEKNRVVLADGPEREDINYPTEAELLAIFDVVESKEIEPYEDVVLDEPLLSEEPSGGSIVDETHYADVDITRLVLSNGSQVILKTTDFKNDEVLVLAKSPGGTSIVDDERYTPAEFAATLIGQSGVGAFGPIELEKKLAGKVVSVSPYIGDLSEGFRGSGSPADLETLFQLVHLYFTSPRADSVTYQSYRQRIGSLLLSMKADPTRAFSDTVSVTMAQYHPRAQPFSQETLDRMNLDVSFEVFKERFADAGDFTYFIVGAFDTTEVRRYVEKYLAGLPSAGRTETWRDIGIRPPTGHVEKAVYRGIEPKSRVFIAYTGEATWSNRGRRVMSVLDNVLTIRLREVLREDLGGTYGVQVNGSLQRRPYEAYRIIVSFGCDPERVEELTSMVYGVIDTLKTQGTTATNLQKTRETSMTQHKVGLEQNSYWLSSMDYYEDNGLAFSDIPGAMIEFFDTVTLEEVQEATSRYFNTDNVIRVVLYPEENVADP